MDGLRGRVLVAAPGGGHDFGLIDSEVASAMRRPPGPIRLHYGYPGDTGYGLLHVEGREARIRQIRNIGFPGFTDFAAAVCAGYEIVAEGHSDRFLLIRPTSGRDLYVVVQYDRDGHWSITTGIPARTARYRKEIFRVPRTGGSEPAPDATGARPRLATLSLPGGDAPTGDKGP